MWPCNEHDERQQRLEMGKLHDVIRGEERLRQGLHELEPRDAQNEHLEAENEQRESDLREAVCAVQPRAWSLRMRLGVGSAFAAILILVVTAAVLLTRKKPAGPLAVTVSLAAAGSGGSGSGGRWALQLGLNQAPSCQQTGASLAAELPALGTSLIRTHDQRALDLFTLFPNPNADPEVLANYDFSGGDALFADIRATGHRVYLRLGVSWPLGAPPVLPPVPAWSLCPPAELMARVALHTVQHYSALFPNQIAYVEVWNEPDGTSPVMWCGTDAEFYALYNATAATLKAYFPGLRVGGPAVTRPSSPAYGVGFANYVVASGAPLDFFSWHSYGTNAGGIAVGVAKAVAAVRVALDSAGLTAVEQHITEWNTDATPARTQRDKPLAAAYVAAALAGMAAGGASVALFYPGCWGVGASSWGLFQDSGGGAALSLRPETYAFRAAGQTLRDTPWPLAVPTAPANAAVLAGAAAPPSPNGLAANVSIVVATQDAAAYNSLVLTVTGLPPLATFVLATEVIDEGFAGAPVAARAAAASRADGTLTVSLAITPPAVIRIQLLFPLP